MFLRLIIFQVFATFGLGSPSFYTQKLNNNSVIEPSLFELMIGIRVEFQEEDPDYAGTSGIGQFLNEIPQKVYERCDGFLLEKPNHDAGYFLAQMEAVKNYYIHVSNHEFTFDYVLLDSVYNVSNSMINYSQSDSTLGDFFNESITLAEHNIIEAIQTHFPNGFTEENLNNTLITIFHAGIGQDFAVPFLDPTPNDLPSAYIEQTMLSEIVSVNGFPVDHGLLLPETENHIYYDGIEDMFWGETEFCDYQVGMTGIFSFLVGYAIGLPPLFNTDTGETGIGVFGLMDHGSNNGRGVIPAPPDAWSRIYMGWTEPTMIMNASDYEISARHVEDVVFKIPITEEEYFLIENRKNDIFGNTDLIDLIWEDPYNPKKWFNVIQEIIDTSGNDHFRLNETYNIIESVNNYDFGIPGTGLLIWHISEPNDYSIGINNNPEHRAIHLEEADGAVDLGFENIWNPFYDAHTIGWKWDMWFKGNIDWGIANPAFENIEFSNNTIPNSKSNVETQSNIRISEIESEGEIAYFTFTRESEMNWIELTNEGNFPIGGGIINKVGTVFFMGFDSIYQITNLDTISYNLASLTNLTSDFYSVITEDDFEIISSDSLSSLLPSGYVHSYTNSVSIDSANALGDIDLDGLDEIFYFSDNKLHCINGNGTLVNGFPVDLINPHSILVANINGDNHPEIILKDETDLVILSHVGIELLRESSYQNSAPMIIPNWDGDYAALIDANHAHLFQYDDEHTYWPLLFGQSNGNPISSGEHFELTSDFNGIPNNKVYNYPNPITEGETTFRFFVGNNFNPNGGAPSSVKIEIYNVSGRIVESLNKNDLTLNEYNEIKWRPENLNAGVYLAEVAPNVGKSHLIHVLYLK